MDVSPDGLDRLWTPHRMAYIKGGGDKADDGCPFDRAPHLPPDESLVVARGRWSTRSSTSTRTTRATC